MKKNIAMRVAAFLFILTMISTCAFATTFAKYATSGSASDDARVAKWGVEVTATGADDLFADDYNGKVTSSTEDDVVAPGTSGSLADFTVSGEPEVDVKVTYSATLTLTGWTIGSGDEATDYCPIVITVNGTECKGNTMAALKSAVEAAVAAQSATVETGNPITDSLVVTWSWAFDGDDLKDTELGNLDVAPTIALAVTCTVVQVN